MLEGVTARAGERALGAGTRGRVAVAGTEAGRPGRGVAIAGAEAGRSGRSVAVPRTVRRRGGGSLGSPHSRECEHGHERQGADESLSEHCRKVEPSGNAHKPRFGAVATRICRDRPYPHEYGALLGWEDAASHRPNASWIGDSSARTTLFSERTKRSKYCSGETSVVPHLPLASTTRSLGA